MLNSFAASAAHLWTPRYGSRESRVLVRPALAMSSAAPASIARHDKLHAYWLCGALSIHFKVRSAWRRPRENQPYHRKVAPPALLRYAPRFQKDTSTLEISIALQRY